MGNPKGYTPVTAGKHYHQMVAFAKAKKKPNSEVFVENSTLKRDNIKHRIITDKLFPYICESCGNIGEYNGKKLVLHLDHRNGINNDNRIDNLRFLCPNCHSQTDTYAAKNIKFQRGLVKSV